MEFLTFFCASRQSVNKTESRVEIVFDIEYSKVFNLHQKPRISSPLKKKIVNGSICKTVQEKRTQYQNRQLAISKIASLVKEGFQTLPNSRKITKPTKASQKKNRNKNEEEK